MARRAVRRHLRAAGALLGRRWRLERRAGRLLLAPLLPSLSLVCLARLAAWGARLSWEERLGPRRAALVTSIPAGPPRCRGSLPDGWAGWAEAAGGTLVVGGGGAAGPAASGPGPAAAAAAPLDVALLDVAPLDPLPLAVAPLLAPGGGEGSTAPPPPASTWS